MATEGRGSVQVVSVLTYFSDDPRSTVISVKFVFEKNENEPKEAGLGPFQKRLATAATYVQHKRLVAVPY